MLFSKTSVRRLGILCSVWHRPMPCRADSGGSCSVDTDILRQLEQRLRPIPARQRLGIEIDHEAQVFGQGLTFFHLENLSSAHVLIRTILKMTGLYPRGLRNAAE